MGEGRAGGFNTLANSSKCVAGRTAEVSYVDRRRNWILVRMCRNGGQTNCIFPCPDSRVQDHKPNDPEELLWNLQSVFAVNFESCKNPLTLTLVEATDSTSKSASLAKRHSCPIPIRNYSLWSENPPEQVHASTGAGQDWESRRSSWTAWSVLAHRWWIEFISSLRWFPLQGTPAPDSSGGRWSWRYKNKQKIGHLTSRVQNHHQHLNFTFLFNLSSLQRENDATVSIVQRQRETWRRTNRRRWGMGQDAVCIPSRVIYRTASVALNKAQFRGRPSGLQPLKVFFVPHSNGYTIYIHYIHIYPWLYIYII